jgi:hypothetical protein
MGAPCSLIHDGTCGGRLSSEASYLDAGSKPDVAIAIPPLSKLRRPTSRPFDSGGLFDDCLLIMALIRRTSRLGLPRILYLIRVAPRIGSRLRAMCA